MHLEMKLLPQCSVIPHSRGRLWYDVEDSRSKTVALIPFYGEDLPD
jgi:hypothetical protein